MDYKISSEMVLKYRKQRMIKKEKGKENREQQTKKVVQKIENYRQRKW